MKLKPSSLKHQIKLNKLPDDQDKKREATNYLYQE